MECPYCYRVGSSYGSVNLEEAKEFIDFLVLHNCKTINITGGEPLLNSDWKEIVRYASERNLYTILSTNGILLDIDDPILSYVKVLSLPLDGFDEETNAKTRSREHYNIILSLISKYKNGSYPFCLKINTVLTKYNYDTLLQQLPLLNDKKVIWKIFQLREKGMFYNFPSEDIIPSHTARQAVQTLIEQESKCKIYFMPNEYKDSIPYNVKPNYFVLNYDGDIFIAKGQEDIFLFNIKNDDECKDIAELNLQLFNNQYQEEIYDDFT